MADVTDTRMKERVATEFLTAEEVSSIEIRTGLNSVCVVYSVDVSTVRRWFRHFWSGETEIGYKTRSGRPATAVTADKSRTDALIRQDVKNCKASAQFVLTET
jgi:hypothetical protein